MLRRVDLEICDLLEAARIRHLLADSTLFGVRYGTSRRSVCQEGAGATSPFERITHNKKTTRIL